MVVDVPAHVAVFVALALAQYVTARYLLEGIRQVSNTKQKPEMPGVMILVVLAIAPAYVAPMLDMHVVVLDLWTIRDFLYVVVEQQNGLLLQKVQNHKVILVLIKEILQLHVQIPYWVLVHGLFPVATNY